MNYVLVIDTKKEPQVPVHPAEARVMLREGRAAVWRLQPFTIILKEAVPIETPTPRLRLKLDPGSSTTGVAVVDEATGRVVFAAEIEHRGERVKLDLAKRKTVRRSRRVRKTRYRAPRFENRAWPRGWLPPSIRSRLANIETWVGRLRSYAPITAISVETARFDTQLMANPEISGVEYQQGTLAGYDVREYLLEKYGRRCVYCRTSGVALEVEHVRPRTRGGSDRVANLVTSCRPCNQAKGNLTAGEFGHPEVEAAAGSRMDGAAKLNQVRYALPELLRATGLPVEIGTGSRTKYNRTRMGLEKSHWADAACVGESTPDSLRLPKGPVLKIRAMGRGRRQMCLMDRHGFPRSGPRGSRTVHGFRTGDVVRAVVPRGKYAGIHIGRVMVRARGSFALRTGSAKVDGISHRHCLLVQRDDGYRYVFEGGKAHSSAPFTGQRNAPILMRIEIYPELDAVYVGLKDCEVKSGRKLDESRYVDFNGRGELIGVEFLYVSDGIDLDSIPGLEGDHLGEVLKEYNIKVLV